MTKGKIRNCLDLIPLAIIIIYSIILLHTVASSIAVFSWKHIVGLSFVPLNILLFKLGHKIGVIGLGFTLLLGLLGLLSYTHSITILTSTVGKSEDFQVPIFYGQPIFLLWLLIHFLVSGRHYFGVLTKQYWVKLYENSRLTYGQRNQAE